MKTSNKLQQNMNQCIMKYAGTIERTDNLALNNKSLACSYSFRGFDETLRDSLNHSQIL